MNSNKIRAGVLAAVLFGAGALGLAGCATDSANSTSSNGGSSNSSTQSETSDVAADLETARQAVEDALAENPDWTQVMLAGDVKQPTQKYGLLVMPFVKSDAADRVTGTVNISGGKYVIEAESAATGETWQIDQDGKISQVSE
ncbi:hypothetical protein N3K63_13150 [Microbacterium sp. W1N]|uniref:hypothetical protein n=1 Tax=Microbacterium festucae TaxID=2977531 RepID=UPI0021BEE813|nr:hypothetical protein [Microbacterium festucae]MCT9821225.1 hypothetical protein [Microbacterium festucae]